METEACRHCNGSGKQINQRLMGESMRKKRIRWNKTLREVSRKMKISAPYLSDLERGNRAWDAGLISKFENAL